MKEKEETLRFFGSKPFFSWNGEMVGLAISCKQEEAGNDQGLLGSCVPAHQPMMKQGCQSSLHISAIRRKRGKKKKDLKTKNKKKKEEECP